jgi:rhomboid protease GluP
MTSSLASELAQALVTYQGFQPGTVPEASELQAASDLVLTRRNGVQLEIVCLVDRSVDPQRAFGLTLDDLRRIGEACAPYSGSIAGAKQPAVFHVIELGAPASDADQARLTALHRGLGLDVHVRTWSLGVRGGTLWASSAGWRQSVEGLARFLRRFADGEDLGAAESDAEAIRELVPGWPIATFAILAVCAGVFAVEMLLPASPADGFLNPSGRTLVALGALTGAALSDVRESYRLLTATVLHGDGLHLLFNSLALFMAGRALEPRIGRAWLLTLFVIAGLGGSVASALLLAPAGISIGASGAIMGLLAAGLVMSTKMPYGPEKTAIQQGMTQMLVPALLPVVSRTMSGATIDYGAHIGGAVTGALVSAALFGLWKDRSALPVPMLARAIAVAGVVALAFGFTKAPPLYAEFGLVGHLIPNEQMPKDTADGAKRSEALVAKYPRDPRSHWLRAIAYESRGDLAKAKDELKQSLTEEQILRKFFKPDLEIELRAALARLLLDERNPAEARSVVRPVCGFGPNGSVPAPLQPLNVCS